MRNLTIQRAKRFVASLVAMKVYIEDPTQNDLVISGVPCRKLGDLKNGETKTFAVDEGEAKIFVIADKLSKNYTNEFYQLPAGTEDICLSGKNHFNPMAGNPFYFDNVTDEQVLKNRKKGKNKGLLVLIAAALVGVFVGHLASSALLSAGAKCKTFLVEGVQITLTDAFSETPVDGFDFCLSSKSAMVFGLKEPFSMIEGSESFTLEEYGALVLQNNGMDGTASLQKQDGLIWFDYRATPADSEQEVYYCGVVFKHTDAFWLIQFATPVENVDTYRETFLDWAKTIEFTND